MTEVYGQFFEVLEELNFPNDEVTKNNSETSKMKKVNKKSRSDFQINFINHFFQAIEKINLSQYESSESLCSLASSNSLASVKSFMDADNSPTGEIFNALQSLTFSNNESSNSVIDEISYSKRLSKTVEQYSHLLPSMVKHFFGAFDDFMHNHSIIEDDSAINKTNSEDEIDAHVRFPKFC